MLAEWDRRFPGRVENTFNALARVVPSHLMDGRLFDFAGLRADGGPRPDGDIAFDDQPCEAPEADATIGVIRFAETN
jgi:tRNA 2-thiocytidine biosynthesis protein TtcA